MRLLMWCRYHRYAARLPRIEYAEEAVDAYMRSVRYRKFRPYVLAGVLVWMIVRRNKI